VFPLPKGKWQGYYLTCALAMTNYLVHDIYLSAYEVGEILTLIKKQKKSDSDDNCSPNPEQNSNFKAVL